MRQAYKTQINPDAQKLVNDSLPYDMTRLSGVIFATGL